MEIVDLYLQREAVAAKMRQFSGSEKISWLENRGELQQIPVSVPVPKTYLFRSNTCIETKFFVPDGLMVFLGDHTTIGSVIIG